jgi:uncharacterized protein
MAFLRPFFLISVYKSEIPILEEITMDAFLNMLAQTLAQVWTTFTHNWPFLIISTLVAVLLKLYLNPVKVSAFLLRYKNAGVVGATVLGVTTPLCSCGTTAVILGMIASMMPWAPIVAFMVASPLTSPEELIYSAGLFGWPFAIAFFVASIVLGISGGLIAGIFESRGWLNNQNRYASAVPAAAACGCQTEAAPKVWAFETTGAVVSSDPCSCESSLSDCGCGSTPQSCDCDASPAACGCGSAPQSCDCEVSPTACKCGTPTQSCACGSTSEPKAEVKVTISTFIKEVATTGWRLLLMFLGFAFIGYFVNGLIPAGLVASIFGQGNSYSVPLAATLGLPLYINTEASLPLIRALLDGGMSQGAALAFLITGAGTSIGAIAGALTIARWRVIALVIATLWIGAVATGFLFDLFARGF